jgi:uncharacterized protein (TIRG00374 family)
MKRPWLKVLPWLLLAVLLVYVWAFEPFDWHAAWAQVQALPALLWAQLLAVFVLSYAARIARWVLFTRALGVQVPLWHNAVIYMAGFGMGLVLNKVGEAMRSLYLQPYGLHPASGLSAFVVDRLLDVLVAGTFAVLGMVWWNAPAEAAYAVTAVGLLGLLTLRSRRVHRWIGRIPMGRLRRHQQRFMRGLSTLLAGRTLAWGTLLTIGVWCIQGSALALALHAMGHPQAWLVAVGVYCVGLFASAAIPLPGGMGAAEGAITLVLVSLGVPTETALVAAIVSRAVPQWSGMATGLLAMLWLGKR